MSFLTYRLGNGIWGTVDSDSATRIINKAIYNTEEMRLDVPTNFSNSFSYEGIAASGSSTASPVWDVVRTTYDNNGNPSRVQFRSQIVWDSRTLGWL